MSEASASCGMCGATFTARGPWYEASGWVMQAVHDQLNVHRQLTGHEMGVRQ